jgi:hypothetical protein
MFRLPRAIDDGSRLAISIGRRTRLSTCPSFKVHKTLPPGLKLHVDRTAIKALAISGRFHSSFPC